jgi:transcriptional regulator with XRE-family HTH domain
MLLMSRTKPQAEEAPLGIEVRRLRRQAGLTQEQLAEKIGISREALGDIERGDTRQPSDDILDALVEHISLTRQRAFELMGKIPGVDPGDVERVIMRAATETDPSVLLELWRSLPAEHRLAIRRLMAVGLVEGNEQ